MKLVQNLKGHAIDSPAVLASGEIGEVEDSEDVQRLIAAGVLAEVDTQVRPKTSSKVQAK